MGVRSSLPRPAPYPPPSAINEHLTLRINSAYSTYESKPALASWWHFAEHKRSRTDNPHFQYNCYWATFLKLADCRVQTDVALKICIPRSITGLRASFRYGVCLNNPAAIHHRGLRRLPSIFSGGRGSEAHAICLFNISQSIHRENIFQTKNQPFPCVQTCRRI